MAYAPNNIDPADPLHPDGSFFHFMGATAIAQPYYVGVPCATLEQLYQAFKARLMYELNLEEPNALNTSDKVELGEDLDSDDVELPDVVNLTESPKPRGRPRLTEAEREARITERRAKQQAATSSDSVQVSNEALPATIPVVSPIESSPAPTDGVSVVDLPVASLPPLDLPVAVADVPACPF